MQPRQLVLDIKPIPVPYVPIEQGAGTWEYRNHSSTSTSPSPPVPTCLIINRKNVTGLIWGKEGTKYLISAVFQATGTVWLSRNVQVFPSLDPATMNCTGALELVE